MMRLRIIPALALALGAMLLSTVPAWAAKPTSGAKPPVEHTYYVAPNGHGTACTAWQPCQLTTARHLVSTTAPGMTGNLVVNLLGGVYHLRSPFVLTSQDSGQNGHQVIWQAAPGARPVFNGGYTVHGWRLFNPARNIWRAPVPAGMTTRQFYVNGQREQPSSGPASLLGKITLTATGYTITNPAIDHWPNLTSTELLWTGSPGGPVYYSSFVQARCPIASAQGDTLTVQNPCWAHSVNPNYGVGLPTTIENNIMLLNEPGQWYLDPTSHYIYYIPRPHQDLATADTVIPVSHGLLEGDGTPSQPIHNITVSGLTFQYSSWGEPSSDNGYLPIGWTAYVTPTANMADIYNPDTGATVMPPGAVAFHAAHHVTLTDNTLKDLGGTGLTLNHGSQNSLVAGNVITDTSGNGIVLGGWNTPPNTANTGLTVRDNYLFNVATEYEGGVGINGFYIQNSLISHNEIADTPYSGIAILSSENISIADNYVHDVMQSSLFDGGAIYTGPVTHGTISGNYVSGDPQPFGEIYLDAATSYVKVTGNVIAHTSTNWIYIQWLPGSVDKYDTVTGNYADTNTLGIGGDTPSNWNPSNIVTGNDTGLTTWPPQAQRIMGNAGLSRHYQHIKRGYPDVHDLAYQRPVTASSSAPGSTPANVVDGDSFSNWYSQSTGHAAWITIDLGVPRKIDFVHLLTPEIYNPSIAIERSQPSIERQDFQVWLSNGGAYTHGTLACSYGTPPLPVWGTLSCPVNSHRRYRYVTVVSTDNGPLAFAEIRVMGPTGMRRD